MFKIGTYLSVVVFCILFAQAKWGYHQLSVGVLTYSSLLNKELEAITDSNISVGNGRFVNPKDAQIIEFMSF